MIRVVLIVLTLVALFGLASSLVVVPAGEFVLVTRFGAVTAAYDGGTDSGPHIKLPWPVESATRIDRRVQALDLPPVESLTRDPAGGAIDKTIILEAYVVWRVPDGEAALRFARTLGTQGCVERVLAPQLAAEVADAITALPATTFLAVADEATLDARRDRFRRHVLRLDSPTPLAAQALADYGVEIVDLRLKKVRYPEAIRASIAERIRSERARKAAEYEAEGRRRAAEILTQADAEAARVLADADARAIKARGAADAEADGIRLDAARLDPELYRTLQKLDAAAKLLAGPGDLIYLSTRHPLFDVLLGPPPASGGKP